MANPKSSLSDTKNPGRLAGHTGVRNDLAERQERGEAYNGRTPRSSNFDMNAWAAACDSFFDCAERTARIVEACRVLAELLPDSDDYPERWLLGAVQS